MFWSKITPAPPTAVTRRREEEVEGRSLRARPTHGAVRSPSGGRSWGRSARLTSSNREALYTNPTALADAQTGRVWVLYQRCNSTAPVPYAACTNVLRWTDAADATEGAAVQPQDRWHVECMKLGLRAHSPLAAH